MSAPQVVVLVAIGVLAATGFYFIAGCAAIGVCLGLLDRRHTR